MSYDSYRNEAEECRVRISEYEQRMAESTTRSLRHLDEAYDIGAEAGRTLECQSEQLGRIETNLDEIDTSCGKADKELTNIHTIFGGVVNYFKKDKTTTTKGKPQPEEREVHQRRNPNIPVVARERPEARTIVDENLDQIDSGLDMLNEMALKLGEQIDDSSKQLDRISDKQDKVNNKVNKLNKKITKLC